MDEINNDTQDYDLVVLGCSREPLVKRMARRTVPDTIAYLCDKPLIMVNAAGGIHSWIKRWL